MTQINKYKRYVNPKHANYVAHPDMDGVDHVNVYSNGRTELGKFLSNLAHTPFTHPTYGKFASIEGFWHWVSTGFKHEVLRTVFGYKALQKGRSYPKEYIDNFEEIIKQAIEAKIQQYPLYQLMLMQNKLPLAHYFVFKKDGALEVKQQMQFRWINAHIEHYARKLRKE